jgi:hypothetical protein
VLEEDEGCKEGAKGMEEVLVEKEVQSFQGFKTICSEVA